MRCALKFDENEPLIDQKLRAWGEMQSLEEEPCYREEDIKDEAERGFYKGYKYAADEVCAELYVMLAGGEISKEAYEWLDNYLCRNLAMHLFSILDNQAELN